MKIELPLSEDAETMDIDKDLAQQIIKQLWGLVVVDENANIVYIEEEYAQSLGVSSSEELVGKPVEDIIRNTKLKKVLMTGKSDVSDLFYTKYSGWTVCSRRPIFKDGKMVGAFSYAIFETPELIDNFLKKANQMTNELNYYKSEIKKMRKNKYSINNIIGSSSAITELKKEIYNAAATNSTVLVQGETGVGKELVVNAIVDLSERKYNSFIRINCASIPAELMESEFFGYEDGAFTGAKKGGKKGKFEMANKGTLFLDEVCQLPIYMQAKLLRCLQEREVDRIGGYESIPVDVRIISASNRELEDLVKKGQFRQDLYYRLNVIKIFVPPLRERKEDIPELVENFMLNLNETLGTKLNKVSKEVIDLLKYYDWPGNVRELQNVIERAMSHAYLDKELKLEHFEWFKQKLYHNTQLNNISRTKKMNNLKAVKSYAEKEAIIQALEMFNGNKSKAADYLHISRSILYRKMKNMGIEM